MCKITVFCFTFIYLFVEVVEKNEVELCQMQLLEFVHHHARVHQIFFVVTNIFFIRYQIYLRGVVKCALLESRHRTARLCGRVRAGGQCPWCGAGTLVTVPAPDTGPELCTNSGDTGYRP